MSRAVRASHPPIQEIFQNTISTQREFAINVPRPQSWLSHYDNSREAWVPTDATTLKTGCLFLAEDDQDPSSSPINSSDGVTSRKLHVITWNIDFLVPWGRERMLRALDYLGHNVLPPLMQKVNDGIVVMFQEMSEEDVELILTTDWVRQWFAVSDAGSSTWGTPVYGTITLVSHTLHVTRMFRVPLESKMSRDGLFVDVYFPDSAAQIRICNLHLESLIANPPLRPSQVATIAKYLHDVRFSGSVAAGDCNAIQPFDRTLHSEHDLEDLYLYLGGKEGEAKGNTWGYQEKEERFPPGRLDKVFYVPGNKRKGQTQFIAQKLEKIGVGVKVEDEEVVGMMEEWGDLTFVTDHYGLLATFVLPDGQHFEASQLSQL